MDEFLYKHLRQQLKSALYQYRTGYHSWGFTPICGHCGGSDWHQDPDALMDMHEVILDRRDIMGVGGKDGHLDIMAKIMVPQNCVLVHRWCHSKAQSDTIPSIQHLLRYEGYGSIMDWLRGLEGIFKTGIIDEKKRLVTKIHDGGSFDEY